MPTETPSPISGRTNIRSLSQDQLAGELASLGAPSYRVKQVVDWVWKKGVTSFDQMTNLPASLRKELEERFVLGTTHEVTRQVSVDGSRKYLLELEDGVCVECVGMPSPSGRLAVCASTQAGCGMGCAFCATGATGLARSLTADEIYDQVMHVSDDFASRVTSVVLMGQGEPFANYDATMAALRRLNSPDDGLGIGARHLTVSTCGVIPGITRFANEPEQFTLAISLHSAVQTTRNAIMPGVRRWSLVHLHDVLATYVDKTGRRPPTNTPSWAESTTPTPSSRHSAASALGPSATSTSSCSTRSRGRRSIPPHRGVPRSSSASCPSLASRRRSGTPVGPTSTPPVVS